MFADEIADAKVGNDEAKLARELLADLTDAEPDLSKYQSTYIEKLRVTDRHPRPGRGSGCPAGRATAAGHQSDGSAEGQRGAGTQTGDAASPEDGDEHEGTEAGKAKRTG